MRYRLDWYSQEWKRFNADDQINPVSHEEWWEEYQKWHRSFDNFSDFLKAAQAAIKAIISDPKDLKRLQPSLSLLGDGAIKKLCVNDLELSAVEVDK